MTTMGSPSGHLVTFANRAIPIISRIQQVAAFDLPPGTSKKIQLFHSQVTAKPLPLILKRLTIDGGSRKDWLKRFTESVLDHVQEGLAACHYHFQNVVRIERQITALALESLPELKLDDGIGIAGGNTRQLNFEYQSFVFAIRRTLEYFAVSVGTFFKCEVHRIRALTKSISDADPADVREKVIQHINSSLKQMDDILPPTDEDKSVRDLLAHWKSVEAGVLNISSTKEGVLIGFAGGGENIRLLGMEKSARLQKRQYGGVAIMALSPLLEFQIQRVEQLVFDTYTLMNL